MSLMPFAQNYWISQESLREVIAIADANRSRVIHFGPYLDDEKCDDDKKCDIECGLYDNNGSGRTASLCLYKNDKGIVKDLIDSHIACSGSSSHVLVDQIRKKILAPSLEIFTELQQNIDKLPSDTSIQLIKSPEEFNSEIEELANNVHQLFSKSWPLCTIA